MTAENKTETKKKSISFLFLSFSFPFSFSPFSPFLLLLCSWELEFQFLLHEYFFSNFIPEVEENFYFPLVSLSISLSLACLICNRIYLNVSRLFLSLSLPLSFLFFSICELFKYAYLYLFFSF